METQKSTNTTEPDIRCTGVVKWFNSKLGYGFLSSLDRNEDVFVHISELTNRYLRSDIDDDISPYSGLYLVPGEYVEYTRYWTSHIVNKKGEVKIHAREVTGIRRGQLMCEFRSIQKRQHLLRESAQQNEVPTNGGSNGYPARAHSKFPTSVSSHPELDG